jgi:general secretion pathway protein G
LIAALAILLVLTTTGITLARLNVKREKERVLRRYLWEMRNAH